MMGQEIGTTLTAQIAAFKLGDLCFLFIALGFVMIEFIPKNGWRDYGEIVLGFGVLFLGMNLMSDALKVVTQAPIVATWLAFMGKNVLAGVLAGTVATAIVQSSSAITGLVVAMGISNAITLPAAISILLGANIGTCVTGFLASFRLSTSLSSRVYRTDFDQRLWCLALYALCRSFCGFGQQDIDCTATSNR